MAIYILKLVYLLAFPDSLDKISKKLKVPEMIVSLLFLVTGLWMLANVAQPFRSLYVFKLVAVFASIPLAVLGFKKKNKAFGLASVLLIVGAYGLAEMGKKQILKPQQALAYTVSSQDAAYDQILHGQALYLQYCTSCHGENGDKGLSGAKNLKISTQTPEQILGLLEKGKNSMPSYKGVFSPKETEALVAYLIKMRN
jgi:cytochrome c5